MMIGIYLVKVNAKLFILILVLKEWEVFQIILPIGLQLIMLVMQHGLMILLMEHQEHLLLMELDQ